jgi:NAD(P)-dependent dehydrogenase (short-subunit alcohol dehydrogenase family)
VPTVLITGANRGLGLEFARQYAADGWDVLACCRDPERAGELKALGGKVAVHRLDVEEADQLAALKSALGGRAIDVLLSNAGYYAKGERLGQLDYPAWERSFRINTLGPVRLAEALVDQVARSEKKLIANVTSLMGSIGDNESGGSYAYRSSKAALNMATVCLARDLAPRGVTAIVLHPGWVKTDMGGPGAPLEAPESVKGMRAVIARVGPADTGTFFDYEGDLLPW